MRLSTRGKGLTQGELPDPAVIIICGASGDLAQNILLPSLYSLFRRGLLPDNFAILGFAVDPRDDETFRQETVTRTRTRADFDEDCWRRFARHLHYQIGNFTDAAEQSYARLAQRLQDLRAAQHLPDNFLFHLATLPQFYGEIVSKCARAGLLAERAPGWRRVIIEKPFGRDRPSARQLDEQLHAVIREEQLYRVDHFLGKETVQNMLVFRFANPGFEPIWNHHYVDHVQITAAEYDGIRQRGAFYEKVGVVRDMVQNHLLQLMCIAAMEPPLWYDGPHLRSKMVEVLQAVRPLDLPRDAVLGQYAAGAQGGAPVHGYRQEPKVAPNSTTPTFAALRLAIDNWRWSGVPFFLRTGKRMARQLTEVSIFFKPTPHTMFPGQHTGPRSGNLLTFRLSPEEGIIHDFFAKQPGPKVVLQPVSMNFRYDEAFGIENLPSAYEWLLYDALRGDQTLFPHSDWIDQAWAIMDPLTRHHEQHPQAMLPYAAGTWGPDQANRLLQDLQRAWYNGEGACDREDRVARQST